MDPRLRGATVSAVDRADLSSREPLELGRRAFAGHAWASAHAQLAVADAAQPLEVDDLEHLAIAAHMLGRSDDATRAWERAYQAAVRGGDFARAIRDAFHLVMGFGQRGDVAQASGWFGRASGLVEKIGPDSVEPGYLLIPQALRALDGGDSSAAFALFDQAAAIAARFDDPDLSTLGRLGRGQSLIALGETARGVAFLDEAMVAVTAGEVSPINAGIIYCAAIEAFQAIFDLRRAQEWTTALSRWCDDQPDLVPFRGRCLVYRAELMQFHGRWEEASEEARRAENWMSRPPIEPAIGEAYYQQAELHRLRGDDESAERSYRSASQWGRRPDPGLALLRLGQGDTAAAASSIRRAIDEADEFSRPRLLEACVEIMLGGHDVPAARVAADELTRRAATFEATLPRAIAVRADGSVGLAEGDARAALALLRRAWDLWLELDAPYESARVRIQIALACRSLGDAETADLELGAARAVLAQLGAVRDVAQVDELIARTEAVRDSPLSPREIEVLRLLAHGRTNREIAAELGISERTVDRHVSNLFAKLDVSTRSAATAHAYEHRLV
jgi:ATP/maltotriose-dependent transcriptional regulator MalT